MTAEPAGARAANGTQAIPATNGAPLTSATNGARGVPAGHGTRVAPASDPASRPSPAAVPAGPGPTPIERVRALLSAAGELVDPRLDPLGHAFAAVLDAALDLAEAAEQGPAAPVPAAERLHRLQQAHAAARAACSACWYAVVEAGDQARRAAQ